jgi:RNA polymerase sigma factor (sigma-70 family)
MDLTGRYRWIATNIMPHEAELRGWLRRRLGSLGQNDVDDLVQEAFSRVWTADFASIRNGRAYFFTTVRHLLAEYARRRQIVPIELLGEIDSLNISGGEPGPDRQVAARQELAQLRSVVATLPVQCRRVFELRKFEGLSHREISLHMGISEKTVENHLTRALSRITQMLVAKTPGDIAMSPASLSVQEDDADRGQY